MPGTLAARRDARRVAALDGAHHRVTDDARGRPADMTRPSPRDPRARSIAVRGHDAVHQARRHDLAAVGDGRGHQRHLERCHEHLALAEARRRELRVGPRIRPGVRRRALTWLATVGSSNAMGRSKPSAFAGRGPQCRRARVQRRVGEPDVAGHLHRLLQVERLVELHVPVRVTQAEPVHHEALPRLARLGPVARCEARMPPVSRPAMAVTSLNTDPGTYAACVARSSRGDVGIRPQRLEVGPTGRGRRQPLGVVGGAGDERQDATGRWLERHDRPPVVPQQRRCQPLQPQVDRELQVGRVDRVGPELAQQVAARAPARSRPTSCGS